MKVNRLIDWKLCVCSIIFLFGEKSLFEEKGHIIVPFLRLISTEAMKFLYEIALSECMFVAGCCLTKWFVSFDNRAEARKCEKNSHQCAKSTAHKYIGGQVARVTHTCDTRCSSISNYEIREREKKTENN